MCCNRFVSNSGGLGCGSGCIQSADNLVALVAGEVPAASGGELLLWDVHQDTVAVQGMTVEPFGGEVREGRVYRAQGVGC